MLSWLRALLAWLLRVLRPRRRAAVIQLVLHPLEPKDR